MPRRSELPSLWFPFPSFLSLLSEKENVKHPLFRKYKKAQKKPDSVFKCSLLLIVFQKFVIFDAFIIVERYIFIKSGCEFM